MPEKVYKKHIRMVEVTKHCYCINNINVKTIPVGNFVVSPKLCLILYYLWKQLSTNSTQAVDVPFGKLALASLEAILLTASLILSSNHGGTVFNISTTKHPRDLKVKS